MNSSALWSARSLSGACVLAIVFISGSLLHAGDSASSPWIGIRPVPPDAASTGAANPELFALVAAVYENPATAASKGSSRNVRLFGGTVFNTFPTSCIVTLQPPAASHGSGAGTGSVVVTTDAGCSWTAVSNSSWIAVSSGASGTGSGSVSYSVSANESESSRQGSLTIAGLTFTVSQEGSSACTYSISPTSRNHGPGAESGGINVSAAAGCQWTATTADSWITIASGASGSGNGTVSYRVAANAGALRTGTIAVARQSFSVIQEGQGGAVPSISNVHPTSVPAGAPSFELTLNGINFEPGSKVRWNGQERATTYIGVTQLRAAILAADVAASGKGDVTVANPGGGVSEARKITVTPSNNPIPVLRRVSPMAWPRDGTGFRMVVFGSDFVPGSKVLWNGAERSTTFESETMLMSMILPTDMLLAGKWPVSVLNPGPGGGESGRVEFEVVVGTCVTDLSPNMAQWGGPGFKLSIFGKNLLQPQTGPLGGFSAGSGELEESGPTAFWNGQSMITSVMSSSQLSATVPAGFVGSEGTASITTSTGGGASNAVPIPISLLKPVPLVNRLVPDVVPPGSGKLTLSLEGRNFTLDSKVLWNGSERTTKFFDSTRLEADIPATDTALAGASTVTVLNPIPGGGESNRQTLSLVNTLLFPRLVSRDAGSGGDATSEYTGIAVANLGAEEARLTFSAFGTSGQAISGSGITNPALRTVGAGRQLPVLDYQVFGDGLTAQKAVGWFKMESSGSKAVGFFLMFDRDLTILDGADVSSKRSMEWIVPEIEELGFTQIHVANPDIQPTQVMLELYGSDGKLRTPAAVRNLAGDGAIAEKVSELFPTVKAQGSDYVRVTTDRGVALFEYMGKTEYVQGLNGQDPAKGAAILYSPQYVVGGTDWRTTITVVNLDDRAGVVTFRFIGEDGSQIGETKLQAVAARGKIHISDQKFFLDPSGQTRQGYVEIKSDGVKLVGSMVFGDPGHARFSSSLPLVSELGNDLVFSQVASNDTYYTGLAILNPGDAAANAVVEVYDADGKLVAAKSERIESKRRRSALLTQWFPELVGSNRSSGYIRVKSDGGVASFALFGTSNFTALSAVPAQSVP